MRVHEFAHVEELNEDWRKTAAAAAVAAGLGLGSLGFKQKTEPPASAPAATQSATAPAAAAPVQPQQTARADLQQMDSNEILNFIKDQTGNLNWRPNEFQQFLAQVMHETNNLRHMAENLYYTTPQRIYKTFTSAFRSAPEEIDDYVKNPQALANRVYANRMGNGPEQSGDGWNYRGRGLLHITGKEMYKRVGQGIGVDLVRNPDLLTNNPDVSLKAALWYWQNIVSPKVGTGFHDTTAVTKAINPGMAGLKNRKQQFAQQVRT